MARSAIARATTERHYTAVASACDGLFDWLLFSTVLTAIVKLDDHGAQIPPELMYTDWQDMELCAQAVGLRGVDLSDFGVRAAARRFELSLRRYF